MNGMIDKKDYEQVFEETISVAIDAWALLAVKCGNDKFLSIILTWAKYHWRKHGGDKIKKCEDVNI